MNVYFPDRFAPSAARGTSGSVAGPGGEHAGLRPGPHVRMPGMPDTGTGVAGARALLGDEPLEGVAAGLLVVPAGHAAARRGARHRADAENRALVQGTQAGHGGLLAPDAVLLADQERRVVTAVIVGPAGGAVARRGARHRVNRPAPWDVQVAGDFPGASPAAVHLTDHEHIVAGAVVAAASRAVARRGARQRVNESAQARAGVDVSRDFLGGAPAAARLADHECLQAAGGVAGVVPAGRAVARRG